MNVGRARDRESPYHGDSGCIEAGEVPQRESSLSKTSDSRGGNGAGLAGQRGANKGRSHISDFRAVSMPDGMPSVFASSGQTAKTIGPEQGKR